MIEVKWDIKIVTGSRVELKGGNNIKTDENEKTKLPTMLTFLTKNCVNFIGKHF